TLRIDLWTKEMQVTEMDRFMYQILSSLSQTYLRATQNKALAEDMARFAHYFGQQTEIVPKEG
ncbi:MAG TPA: gliding motility protein GldC, partial [Saprospiraceae bacterium]|nr:gliding motility protein GldC [Saprospiraceae bacterium]